jgi:large subunit ribosomal protein L22
MSKKTAPRDLPDTEAKAFASSIRTSPRKLNLVAQSIRGLEAEAALAQLTFSKRRIAQDVKKVLQSAIANAENNHQLDVDRLVVAEAFVGKALIMKRWRARARGRVGKIVKPFSNLTVIVREREESAGEEKA